MSSFVLNNVVQQLLASNFLSQDGLPCGDKDWVVTTCKKNLNFQQAKDDAFERKKGGQEGEGRNVLNGSLELSLRQQVKHTEIAHQRRWHIQYDAN